MSVIYTTLAFAEILTLFASFVALLVFLVRAIVRSFVARREPLPKPEDLRQFKRAGQSGFH